MRNIFYFNFETNEKKILTSFSEIKNNLNFLAADLELLDFKILSKKYNLNSSNQFDFLIDFLKKYENNVKTNKIDENLLKRINELKGFYSIIYSRNNKIRIYRDLIGVKPICYSFNKKENKFEFSSELKFLKDGIELNPRKYLIYNKENKNIQIRSRNKYYKPTPTIIKDYNIVKEKTKKIFEESIKKNLKDSKNKKIGILFSGGTDSTLIALTLKKLKIKFTAYTSSIVSGNITEGDDIYYARKIAKECNFNWKLIELKLENIEQTTKEVIKIIDDRKYTKISVAVPLYIALKQAKKDGINFMFIGIGSEEIFADYKRDLEVKNINKICIEGLQSLWIRDLYRDNNISIYNKIELKFPFLNDNLIKYCIRIKPEYKIDKINKINKIILRDILKDFGLSKKMVERTKKAAQYGSRSDRVYEKICKKLKIKKQEYLNSL